MNHNLLKRRRGLPANQAMETSLSPAEQAGMIAAAADKFAELFDILHIDYRADHNTRSHARTAGHASCS